MSTIITILLLVSIVALASASTSIPDAPIAPQANSNLSRIVQKSTNFCYDDDDCETTKMGYRSSCVSNYCTCDFGYKTVYPSEKCTKIACSYNSDCSDSFSNSRCDVTGSCVCEVNYNQNSATASCEKKKDCTYDWECSGVFTRCNILNKCVCDYGYSKDSYGDCSDDYDYDDFTILPAIFTTVGISLLLIIILTIAVMVHRSKRNARTGGMVSAMGQPGFAVQPNYQGNFQPAPPMYTAPYGNVGEQPPQYAAPYSQAVGADIATQTPPRKI